jgi:hypothetical protein
MQGVCPLAVLLLSLLSKALPNDCLSWSHVLTTQNEPSCCIAICTRPLGLALNTTSCIGNLPPGVRVQADLTAIYLTPPPLTLPLGCGESTHARVYGPTPQKYNPPYMTTQQLRFWAFPHPHQSPPEPRLTRACTSHFAFEIYYLPCSARASEIMTDDHSFNST